MDTALPRSLDWSDDSEPGLRRRRAGRGFFYVDAKGKRVTDPEVLARIRKIVIPPAWTDVWICDSDCGHIQATGRDARGRKQYRYHTDFRAHRDRAKFEHLVEFATALPALRARVDKDLSLRGIKHDLVVATIVQLLESTLVRVGNEEYAQANGSYGLTTLKEAHARLSGESIRLTFRGKHGLKTSVSVRDRRLARAVAKCQELPGQLLFQYENGDGIPRPVRSSDVNSYLRETTGLDLSAKDFRTWAGTLFATTGLVQLPPPRSQREAQRSIAEVVAHVAPRLHNTPAVCRSSYVHPAPLQWFEEGSLQERWDAASGRGSTRLTLEERKLLKLLSKDARARK